MKLADIGSLAVSLAVAVAIIAQNRAAIVAAYHEFRAWYELQHPTGKLWDDVRESLDNA